MKPIENRLRRDLPALADALVRHESGSTRSVDADSETHQTVAGARRQTSGNRFWPTMVTAAAAALLVLGGIGLLLIDRDGTDELLSPVSEVPSQPTVGTDTGSSPTASTGVPDDSLVDPEAAAGVLNADGETVDSCSSFAPMVPVTSAETPFTIRSGLTTSGGTWISVDDASNRRIASTCQDSEALLDGAVEAQLAWPIANDVFVASIEPAAIDHTPEPAWFNSISRYSLPPVRSIAVIGRIAPDTELPAVPDVQSEAAERERQLIDKVEQVRELRNYVSTIAVVDVQSVSSVAPGAMLPVGSFDLGLDDVVARRADGDVYLYPAALGNTSSEPILLIERDDPRPIPVEGEGPNFIDHVAGTYDGMLIYGDCCEPVAGNIFAISEPGAEVDIFTSTTLSDRARNLPHGFNPVLEPSGTRLLNSNWNFVTVLDLATGETITASPGHGVTEESLNMSGEPFNALTTSWTASGTVVVIGRAEDGQIIITEHSPEELRTELRRTAVDATVRAPQDSIDVDILELSTDLISVVVYEPGGLRVVDIDAATFQLVAVDRDFPPPPDATVVRYSSQRDAWAWVVNDIAYLHTPDRGTVEWQRDVADVWFPTIINTGPN